MFISTLRILFKWNSLCLTFLVAILLWIYFHKKQKSLSNNFKVFVPLNSQILTYRDLIIQKDVFLFLCIKFWNAQKYTVDYKMRFRLNELQLQMSYFFVDFYNISSIKNLLINGQPAENKLVHGRIYLDKKLLKMADWNTLEMSIFSDLNFNFFKQNSDQLFVINGSLQDLSSFLPIFEQNSLNYFVSLNLKTTVHKDLLFLAPLLSKSNLPENELYCNFDQKQMKQNEFFLLLSKNELFFNKHSIQPLEKLILEVSISQKVSENFYKTRDLLKIITNIIKEIQFKNPKKDISKLLNSSFSIFILESDFPAANFHSKNAIVFFTSSSKNKSAFKLEIVKLLCFSISVLFLEDENTLFDFTDDKEKPQKNTFQEIFNENQNKIEFTCNFVLNSTVCKELKIIDNFYLSELLFKPHPLPLKTTNTHFTKNFQIYNFLNFQFENRFYFYLFKELFFLSEYKRFLNYSICLSADRPIIKLCNSLTKELHFCRDCIFNSLKHTKPPDFGDFIFFLFQNMRFQKSKEFACVLHFLANFLFFNAQHFDILIKFIKNNIRILDNEKYFFIAVFSVFFYFTRFQRINDFKNGFFSLSQILNTKNIIVNEKFTESLFKIVKNTTGSKFAPHMKTFLKSRHTFQKYYFIKHFLE